MPCARIRRSAASPRRTAGAAAPAATTAPTSATATAAAATTTEEQADLGPRGELVQDPALPYPFNFPEPNTTPKAGGRMVVAATWNFQTIDPITSAAGGTVTIPNTVYNRLLALERGPDAPVFGAGVKGELAACWERSPDGLTFSFNMAEGVTWQNVAPLNGRAFVADDARYALERYATEGVHKSYYLNVAGFETVSDQVFNINMARPTADFLNPLGSNKQTIFPRELVDNGTIETAAVGTSAMILNEAIAGQSVTFDKNPDFWEREVLLDGFTFRLMPDAVARIAAFRVGQVDYAYSLTSNLRDLNKILETNPDIQINLTPVTYNGATLGLNLTLAKYQDERVCRAISLAINLPEIIDIVTDGLAKGLAVIPWTYLLDEEPTIESGVLGNWLRHDLDEAMKLLSAGGRRGHGDEQQLLPVLDRVHADGRGGPGSAQQGRHQHDRRRSRLHRVQLAVGAAYAARRLDVRMGDERVRRGQLVPRPDPLEVARQPLADRRRGDRRVGRGPAGRARSRCAPRHLAEDLGPGSGPDVAAADASQPPVPRLPALGPRYPFHRNRARGQQLVLLVGPAARLRLARQVGINPRRTFARNSTSGRPHGRPLDVSRPPPPEAPVRPSPAALPAPLQDAAALVLLVREAFFAGSMRRSRAQAQSSHEGARWWASGLNRRTLLRGGLLGGLLGGVGLAAAALIGCGGDDDDDGDTAATTTTSGGGTTGTSSSGGASSTGSSGGDSGDDDDAAPAVGEGMLVQDPDLPYPYQFPEPAKTPRAGGRLRVGVTFDVANFDPSVSSAGGTITVPNMVYNRLLGFVGGPSYDPFNLELEPELASAWERTPDGGTFIFQIRDDIN